MGRLTVARVAVSGDSPDAWASTSAMIGRRAASSRCSWSVCETPNKRPGELPPFYQSAAEDNIIRNLSSLSWRNLVGTEITLDVGGVSITYSKNHRGIDHGSLFQEADRKPLRSDQLNYDYYQGEDEDPTFAEMA